MAPIGSDWTTIARENSTALWLYASLSILGGVMAIAMAVILCACGNKEKDDAKAEAKGDAKGGGDVAPGVNDSKLGNSLYDSKSLSGKGGTLPELPTVHEFQLKKPPPKRGAPATPEPASPAAEPVQQTSQKKPDA